MGKITMNLIETQLFNKILLNNNKVVSSINFIVFFNYLQSYNTSNFDQTFIGQ